MFRRTPSGIANEHLFYGVDFTVYCEGEPHNSVYSTYDELFWATLLRHFGMSFHVKSVGNKLSVMEMFALAERENIKNVLFCVDSDYDRLLGDCVDHPAILYTLGYSWESDAIWGMDFSSTFNLFVNCVDITPHRIDFEAFASSFTHTLRKACIVDARYIRAPTPLFNRDNPNSILRNDLSRPPKLNVRRLLLSAANINFVPAVRIRIDTNPWLVFFGKAVAKITYHWFVNRLMRETFARKVPYATFLAHIASTISLNDNDLRDYYEPKIAGFLNHCRS